MYTSNFVFSQLMAHLPMHSFRRCVQRYQGNRYVKSFTCLDQFLCLAFAQLTHRESLRDIEVCLRAHQDKLYHLGLRGDITRNTLAHANRQRDWRLYADFAQALIRLARPLYAGDDLGLELDNTVYALDSSTIDLCLSVFPWAHFRQTKAAVKLHTLLDLQGSIPTFIYISDGKLHDVNILDLLLPEPGAIYVMDRAYLDFQRLFALTLAAAFFVIHSKSNTRYQRRYSHPVDNTTGLICDQTIVLTGAQNCRGMELSPMVLNEQSLNAEGLEFPRLRIGDHLLDRGFVAMVGPFGVYPLSTMDDYRQILLARDMTLNFAIASLSIQYTSERRVSSIGYDEPEITRNRSASRHGLTVVWPEADDDIKFQDE